MLLQDMGMLNHSLEALPWDGGALPGSLPFDDDDDMRMVLDSNGQDVNNRVGGGAGKRLSLPELQVRYAHNVDPLTYWPHCWI